MFYQLCALALIILVLCLAVVRRCSLYSPLVISALIWLVVFITGLIFHERFYAIHENAFTAWLIWFMVTSSIFFMFYPSRGKSVLSGREIRRIPLDYTLPLLLAIAWLGYKIWVVGNTIPDQFFFNLRMSMINLESFPTFGLVLRLYPLVFALFLFEHVYAHQENRHLRILLWCFMLLYALAAMSKASVLTPILSWVIIEGIKGKMKAMRIFFLAIVVFVLMMSVHFIRGGISDESTIVDTLAIYIYSPLVALGYMNIDDSLPFGAHIFRFFYVIGYHLGIAPQPVGLISPYVGVPEPTNVYTAMQPFYSDFGIWGVPLEAVIYGIIFSFLYVLSIKKGGLGLVLFSGYSIALAMQFFTDLLVMFFSSNLQFLIWALAIFFISRRIYYVQ